MDVAQPNLARRWAPRRAKIYLGTGLFAGAVFTLMTGGVATGLIEPTFTADVVANLLFGIPVFLLPLVILWNGPGENRSRLDKATELTMFYLPYTASSQLSYELVFVIGYARGWWTPTADPGWKWFWWQLGLADTRYANGNRWIFGLEIVSVMTGVVVFVAGPGHATRGTCASGAERATRPVKTERAVTQSRMLSECSASQMTPSARQILANELSRFPSRGGDRAKDYESWNDAMTSDVVTHASSDHQPNLARPWAAHRRRTYLLLTAFTGIAFVLAVGGVGLRVLPPTFTVDVIANLLFGVPVILLPLVYFWTGRGQHRPRLERAAELTLIYLPYTAGSQLGYETIFLIGHPFKLWTPTADPGWKWLWWQWGLTDTRYTSANNWIFGLELVGVITGATLFVLWLRLIRPGLPTESRLRCLWLAFAGCAILLSSTGVYFVAEVRAGFCDIGQGAFGFWFKFLAENLPFMILPPFVLYAIYLQIDHLTRRAGAQAAAATALA